MKYCLHIWQGNILLLCLTFLLKVILMIFSSSSLDFLQKLGCIAFAKHHKAKYYQDQAIIHFAWRRKPIMVFWYVNFTIFRNAKISIKIFREYLECYVEELTNGEQKWNKSLTIFFCFFKAIQLDLVVSLLKIFGTLSMLCVYWLFQL